MLSDTSIITLAEWSFRNLSLEDKLKLREDGKGK